MEAIIRNKVIATSRGDEIEQEEGVVQWFCPWLCLRTTWGNFLNSAFKKNRESLIKGVKREEKLMREPKKFPDDKRTWREKGLWVFWVERSRRKE